MQEVVMFTPIQDATEDDLRALLDQSPSRTLRCIVDPSTGISWCWPAEQATHAQGAERLGVPYFLPPGAGEIIAD